jgi:arylsulfatase A-like enzyme
MRAIRTDRYKLIRRFDYHNGIVPANIDDSYSKTFLMDAGYEHATKPREALYDLWLDPAERENLASDARYSAVYRDLSARLERWMLRTNDPLVTHGARVPMPKGAKATPLEVFSPSSTVFEEPDLEF